MTPTTIKLKTSSLLSALRLAAFALCCAAAMGRPAALRAEVEFQPVARLTLLGGQFFFEGEQTSFSGNGDWLVAPAVKFNDSWSLIPTVNGKYRRVREVQELVGGGFLTRETLENAAMVKGIYNASERWKLKAKTTYKSQLLVESEDEKLGKGLYDNNKYSAGFEAERAGARLRSLRFGVEPYAVRYIRYASLASGSQFGSEINSGANTLDFNAYDGTVSADWALFEGTLLSAANLVSYRPFTEQKTVTASGLYTADERVDVYNQTSLGIYQVLPNWLGENVQIMAGLETSYSFLDSNQHNYDASRTKFNEHYYDYYEYHAAPRLAARLFKKLDLGLSYDFGQRQYNQRPTQSSDGTYQSDKLRMNTHSLSYSAKYPLLLGISVVAQGVYRQSTSNMAYERTYRYNYAAQHYFAGLSWEY